MEGLAEVSDATDKLLFRDLTPTLLAPRSPTTHSGNEIAARAGLACRYPPPVGANYPGQRLTLRNGILVMREYPPKEG
jgi:hypothetical protein